MENDDYTDFTARMAFELDNKIGSQLTACMMVCPEALVLFLENRLGLPESALNEWAAKQSGLRGDMADRVAGIIFDDRLTSIPEEITVGSK